MKIELPLPPTTNHAYRTSTSKSGRSYLYKTNEAKRWQKEAGMLINAKRKKKVTFPFVRVDVRYELIYDRDVDSSLKLLFDTIEDIGIVNDDKKIVINRNEKHKKNNCWCGLKHEFKTGKLIVDVKHMDSTK